MAFTVRIKRTGEGITKENLPSTPLDLAELGFITEDKKLAVGDGTANYFAIMDQERGVAGGIAELGDDSIIKSEQLPAFLTGNPVTNVIFVSPKGTDGESADGAIARPYKTLAYVLDTVWSSTAPTEATTIQLMPGTYGTHGETLNLPNNVNLVGFNSTPDNTHIASNVVFNKGGNVVFGLTFEREVTNASGGSDFKQHSDYADEGTPSITVSNGFCIFTGGELKAATGNPLMDIAGGTVVLSEVSVEGNFTTGSLITSQENSTVQINASQIVNDDITNPVVTLNGTGVLTNVMGMGTLELNSGTYQVGSLFGFTLTGTGTMNYSSTDLIKNDSNVTGVTLTDALNHVKTEALDAVNELSGQYAAPVQNITALKALTGDDLVDKQLRLVEGDDIEAGEGFIWRYDANADQTNFNDADNGVEFPTNEGDTGVWFKVQAATQRHDSLIDMNTEEFSHVTADELSKLQNLSISLSGDITGNATFSADGSASVTNMTVNHELGALTNVELSSATDGEVLQYDGTNWKNSGLIDAGTWEE